MWLWELSYFHEQIFVIEIVNIKLLFFVEVLELHEQLMSWVILSQNPGIDDNVSDFPEPRRSHAQLVETVALDHGAGARPDDPPVHAILPGVGHQQRDPHPPEHGGPGPVLVPAPPVSYDGLRGDEESGAGDPGTQLDTLVHPALGQHPPPPGQASHHLLTHQLPLAVHMGDHMGHPLIPLVSLDDFTPKFPEEK